ncbi:MAG: hypothetical protein RIR00_1347 [Pseudomonadota bacterium]
MDKISILGLIIGLTAILGGQILEGGHLSSLFQPTALLIVGGGTLGAVLLQSPYNTFHRGFAMLRWVMVPPNLDHEGMITQIVNWSQIARREGILSLESFTYELEDNFVRNGVQLLVDGADPEHLRELLEVEITSYEEEMWQGARIWEAAGGYSPTIGILGAVMGLIHVMENLTDPSRLGSGIATAFVATIYGVGFANLVFLPIAGKLKAYIKQIIVIREMVVDGLCSIANGDNPRLIESRLRGYLV